MKIIVPLWWERGTAPRIASFMEHLNKSRPSGALPRSYGVSWLVIAGLASMVLVGVELQYVQKIWCVKRTLPLMAFLVRADYL